MPMKRLTIEKLESYRHKDVSDALSRNNPDELLYIPISVSMYDEDYEFATQVCLRLSSHENFNVRANAILGFGHIARRFRQLDKKAKPIIESGLKDSDEFVRGQSVAAADDVKHFLKWKFKNYPSA